MATSGSYQLRLSSLYSEKFRMEVRIEQIRRSKIEGQMMFPAEANEALDELEYHLEMTNEEINTIWATVEQRLDRMAGDSQKSRVFKVSSLGNQCPF